MKNKEIMMEIYRRMFKEAKPSGNFNKMMKSGETKQEYFFMKYCLQQERQDEIVEEVCKENKIRNKFKIHQFKDSCALGCSPTSIKRS